MLKAVLPIVVLFLFTIFPVAFSAEDNGSDIDADLAVDLKLLQGSWELLHGNEGKGPPSIRSVKTIEGNQETLRRYSIKTGKLIHEHSVEFKLSKSGEVHVLTFFRVGGSPEDGQSYVYQVDQESFYDIPGLLHGDKFHNYQSNVTLWHWHRTPDAAE